MSRHSTESSPLTELSMHEISERFFETRRAVHPDDVRRAHRVRFEVYCQQSGYFDPNAYADGLEVDAYDASSVQSLLLYRPTGRAIGAVRLILPATDADDLKRFPFDRVCDSVARDSIQKEFGEETGEVSRFCVTRGLTQEILSTDPAHLSRLIGSIAIDSQLARTIAAQAKIRLLRCVVEMCRTAQVAHLLAVMEPFLLNLLADLGVHFINVGPTVDYHGERQPCYAPLDWLLSVLRREREDVWEVVTDRGRLVQTPARGK